MWLDLLGSINKALRILGEPPLDEREIPDSYGGLVWLHSGVWRRVNATRQRQPKKAVAKRSLRDKEGRVQEGCEFQLALWYTNATRV
jgi:hypothetical protein